MSISNIRRRTSFSMNLKVSILNARRRVNAVRKNSRKEYAIQDAPFGMMIILNIA